MNPYDHEDAFPDANRYAGNKTALSDALKFVSDATTGKQIIADAQKTYSALFDAFIAGVEWGRKHPSPEAKP